MSKSNARFIAQLNAQAVADLKTRQLALGQSQFDELKISFQKQRIILMLRQAKFERASVENEKLNNSIVAAQAEIALLQAELDELLLAASAQNIEGVVAVDQ
ncbi:MAG: hypothetical protein P8L32_08790 [Paracoccaceae bacterium]|nr:hypothetical protein [Paracoccaceae bacterium]